MIDLLLSYIKHNTGISVKKCNYFNEIKQHKGVNYFNIVFDKPVFDSIDFKIIERFSKKYNTIYVLPNGRNRVSVFIYNYSKIMKDEFFLVPSSLGGVFKTKLVSEDQERLYFKVFNSGWENFKCSVSKKNIYKIKSLK